MLKANYYDINFVHKVPQLNQAWGGWVRDNLFIALKGPQKVSSLK